jgi:hypothetical protein
VNVSTKVRMASAIAIAMLTTGIPVFLAQTATAASCSGVSVSAGSSLQIAIDGHGNNTTFCLGTGT